MSFSLVLRPVLEQGRTEENHLMEKIHSFEELLHPSPNWEREIEENVIPVDQLGQKDEKEYLEKPGQFEIWNSIVSQKTEEKEEECFAIPPVPYIHPLAKPSWSSLNEKSLEICTESLGSETGSDRLSIISGSDGDGVEETETEIERETEHNSLGNVEEMRSVVKLKKSPPRTFPAPIPSLSHQMKSRRENGRLVVDAVSVTSPDYLRAERRDGRLLLSFVENTPSSDEDGDGNGEQSSENLIIKEQRDVYSEKLEEETDEESESADEGGFESKEDETGEVKMGIMTQQFKKPINVRTPSILIKRTNKVFDVAGDGAAPPPLAKSLQPRPTAVFALVSSQSPYEYRWGAKNNNNNNNNNNSNNNYNYNNAGGGCKEKPIAKRSILIWEPYTIATSS